MCRALCAALGAVAVFATSEARADSNGALRLSWSTPAGCPSVDEVKSAALRDVDPARVAEPLDASARVEQASPTSWREHLTTRRGARDAGERDLEATTCAGLADATAVILALALEPADAQPKPAQPARPAPREAPEPKPVEHVSHQIALGVGAVGHLGALPNAAAGGAVSLAWTPDRLRVEAEGRLLASQSAHASDGSSAGARFSVTRVGARGCYAVFRMRSFDVAPCAGAGVDVITADGFGASRNLGNGRTVADVSGGGLARLFVVDWLAIRLEIEGVVPLNRPTFVVNGVPGSIYQQSGIGGLAALGAEVLFL